MDWMKAVIIFLVVVLAAAVRFWASYREAKLKLDYVDGERQLLELAPEAIACAEEAYAGVRYVGVAKMDWAVDFICSRFPGVLLIMDRTEIQRILQNVFNQIESYAVHTIDKAAKAVAEKEAAEEEHDGLE